MSTATMAGHSEVEMLSKGRPPSLFASFPRPLSQATEISDSDWEDSKSDSGSEFEEDSPRGSFETATSYDEAPTPQSSQQNIFEVKIQRTNSITGPCGPHLFRTSFDSFTEHALQMSPLFPDKPSLKADPLLSLRDSNSQRTVTSDNLGRALHADGHIEVKNWTAQEVALWMYQAGFEEETIEKFEENDVTGAVLLDLQFEDLRELNIPSFGKRHRIWTELGKLREDGRTSPAPTMFESRPSTRNTARDDFNPPVQNRGAQRTDSPLNATGGARRRRVARVKNVFDEVVTPAESVSIVAIEQLLPKPHKCSKGENCPKWRKQQRILEQLGKEHGFPISPAKGGHIFLAGNLDSVQRDLDATDSTYRPLSDAQPSVVASSDLLGPGQIPSLALEDETLQKLQKRDPQDNVKQFLSFQHVQTSADSPPTPPLETPRFNMAYLPPTPTFDTEAPVQQPVPASPLPNLQNLPKLSIPRSASVGPQTAIPPRHVALSPSSQIRRLGTPASEMDIPLTTIALTPIVRDTSQSVPPNMRYRQPIKHRPGSRDPSTWQRSSMKLATLPEDAPASTRSSYLHTPVKSPIRVSAKALYGAGTTHAGYMKKRKTKFLRHEWAEHHFRLNGTNLAMHTSARPDDRKALETINVEDYSVACSSLASNSKLSAALKNLRITSGKRELSLEEAAFAFQLIPATERAKALSLLKDGKTHHFAVKSRDERIDWMREVMLAKAAKKKEEGFEVTMTGEML